METVCFSSGHPQSPMLFENNNRALTLAEALSITDDFASDNLAVPLDRSLIVRFVCNELSGADLEQVTDFIAAYHSWRLAAKGLLRDQAGGTWPIPLLSEE